MAFVKRCLKWAVAFLLQRSSWLASSVLFRFYVQSELLQLSLGLLRRSAGSTGRAPFFLVVGACDGKRYDDVTPWLHKIPNSRALLVEPLPWNVRDLRVNYSDATRYTIEQCAVANYDGSIQMKFVPESALRAGRVPQYAYGLGTITDRNLLSGKFFFGAEARDQTVKDCVEELTVPCYRLSTLLDKHRVERIDVLLIDVEGFDWNVLSQFDFNKFSPLVVKVEIGCLPPEEIGRAIVLLSEHKYSVQLVEYDLIAIHGSLVGGSTSHMAPR